MQLATFLYFLHRHGYNKTGVLLAVAMLVERIKSERKIDVFRTVKDLRDHRPGMINELVILIFNNHRHLFL